MTDPRRPLACLLTFFAFTIACDKAESSTASKTPDSPAAAPTPAPEPITFGDATPTVGMQREAHKAFLMSIDMQVAAAGQQFTMPFVTAELEKRREEILAVEGTKVTKLLVTYDEVEKKQTDGDGETVEPSPLVGKSYVVTLAGDAVEVTRGGQGKGKVPKAERELVEKDYHRMGKRDAICRRLRAQPPTIGEALEMDGSSFGGEAGGTGSLVLTLREVAQQEGRDWALFEAKLSIKSPIDDGSIEVDVSGTLLVDVQTCSSQLFEAKGPLAMKASGTTKKGTPMEMQGNGEAEFRSAETGWLPAAAK